MRVLAGLLCAVFLGAGCALHKPPAPIAPSPPQAKPPETIITPDFRPVGRVAMVNAEARFVIISFPLGPIPRPGQHLHIDHRGLKIGEVKITGPERDNDTVADLVEGDANVGDEARAE
ncbi:MAG: hypothetical protein ABSH38_06145 [Verrucomicrobiota bacterium]|jgi:hypothetical protein